MLLEKALEVFGISSIYDISIDELKRKYRKLAKDKHPDKTGGTSEDFVELREAYLSLLTQMQKIQGTNKQLKELSKEEILDKYYHDTQDLQLKIENFQDTFAEQITTLDQIRQEVEVIIKEFEQHKVRLQEELEARIAKLEKSYTQNFLKKIFFFLPQMSEDEFWDKYHNHVQKYSRKHADLDMDFFKKMLAAYGDGLNQIAKLISK